MEEIYYFVSKNGNMKGFVNTKGQAQTVRVNVDNATVENGTVIQLTAASNKEENNVNNPYNVTPKEQAVTTDAEGLTYEVIK